MVSKIFFDGYWKTTLTENKKKSKEWIMNPRFHYQPTLTEAGTRAPPVPQHFGIRAKPGHLATAQGRSGRSNHGHSSGLGLKGLCPYGTFFFYKPYSL